MNLPIDNDKNLPRVNLTIEIMIDNVDDKIISILISIKIPVFQRQLFFNAPIEKKNIILYDFLRLIVLFFSVTIFFVCHNIVFCLVVLYCNIILYVIMLFYVLLCFVISKYYFL